MVYHWELGTITASIYQWRKGTLFGIFPYFDFMHTFDNENLHQQMFVILKIHKIFLHIVFFFLFQNYEV